MIQRQSATTGRRSLFQRGAKGGNREGHGILFYQKRERLLPSCTAPHRTPIEQVTLGPAPAAMMMGSKLWPSGSGVTKPPLAPAVQGRGKMGGGGELRDAHCVARSANACAGGRFAQKRGAASACCLEKLPKFGTSSWLPSLLVGRWGAGSGVRDLDSRRAGIRISRGAGACK